MGVRMASFSSRSSIRIIACTPWLAPSVRNRLSGSQGYPSRSSMPCQHRISAWLQQSFMASAIRVSNAHTSHAADAKRHSSTHNLGQGSIDETWAVSRIFLGHSWAYLQGVLKNTEQP